MGNKISSVFSAELFREEGHKIIDTLADYLNKAFECETDRANPWIEPDEMFNKWSGIFEKPGLSFHDLSGFLIEDSLHLHDPRNMGHQLGVPLPHAVLSDTVSSLLNNGMTVFETGPAGTAIERIVIEWICNRIGYGNESGGILTSGGSLGNLTAVLAARQKMADYDLWEEGMDKAKRFVIFVSEEAHYSIVRAAKILGFGNNVVKVPADHRLKMDMKILNELYNESVKENKIPVMVAASACTTSTGTYDHLAAVADFCEVNKLWMHVDGAHGAGAVLTEKYKYLAEGLSRADSVVIDFHKMLMCPTLVTAVLFKDDHNSYEAFAQKAVYLWGQSENKEWFNIGKRSVECTKKILGFKIFVLLKLYGEEIFSEYITSRFDLAREFASFIKDQKDFELAAEPESNIVCFRFNPSDQLPADLNELNSGLRKKMLAESQFYIVETVVKGEVFLRVTLMNPFTDLSHVSKMLDGIRKASVQ